ncbi:MAG: hypothetical protein GKR88_02160 [Flavobacteriaceae bacterium]|nr:MAG: hypothetical protein GKR88_02160 [Flavobacteriaceae bacterium]
MKTRHLFLSLKLFILCLLLSGCHEYVRQQVEFTIVNDNTGSFDHQTMDIQANDIVDLFELNTSPLNYGRARTRFLSDVSLEHTWHISLPFVSDAEYQRYVREAHIRQFGQQIDSILTKLKTASQGKPASNLFTPIVRELQRLENSQADKKILVIYSDLFHNDHEYSVYRRTANLTVFEQEATQFITQKMNGLGSLQGIEVYVVYQPTLQTDRKFSIVSRVFSEILEAKGAQVSVGSNFIKT